MIWLPAGEELGPISNPGKIVKGVMVSLSGDARGRDRSLYPPIAGVSSSPMPRVANGHRRLARRCLFSPSPNRGTFIDLGPNGTTRSGGVVGPCVPTHSTRDMNR